MNAERRISSAETLIHSRINRALQRKPYPLEWQ